MANKKIYDVVLLGAGSAGMFAAEKLSNKGLKMLVIDRGDEPSNTSLGVKDGYSGSNGKDLEKLQRIANGAGIEFIFGRQRHIGTDRLHIIIDKFYKSLISKKVEFRKNTRIREIYKKDKIYSLKTDNETFFCKAVIAAPGRAGSYWLRQQANQLGISTSYGPIDVGVRVEFPAVLYSEIASIMYDAKFRLYSESYDDLVRTFCTNPNGFIVKESFDNFVLVNGHAKRDSKSENTNFALLSRVRLTDPVEDTTKYGRDIARLATTIGGGKPIIQRLSDFLGGRRSTWSRIAKSAIAPTLKDATPGDIAMAFPSRIVNNLDEGLTVLNKVIPGLQSKNTLLYAPEIKFYDTKYNVSKFMETSMENFFVAGDASGHSRGIVYAAVTGMFAADGVLKNFD